MHVAIETSFLDHAVKVLSSPRLGGLATGIIVLYRLGIALYNLFFHPLSRFPGPRLRAVSELPHCRSMWSGYDHLHIKALHDYYGPVVRITPNALSFNGHKAWQDIYGFSQDRKQISKDVWWYLPENIHAQRSLINANDADHARMRKLLAHAFSAQALREQEEILNHYFDLLITRLKQQGGKVDITRWFNFFTFDLVGDLALGKPFGMLEASKAPAFMDRVLRGSRTLIVYWTAQIIPIFGLLLLLYAKLPGASNARQRMNEFAKQCVKERLAEKRDRKDFMSYILRYNDERGMTNAEIGMTAKTLLNAGSETTATSLTGCVWLMLSHPEKLAKATKEVGDKFGKAGEMNLQTTSPANLPYLFAVIEESLRIYTPLGALAFPRRTTQSTIIDGVVVPPDTRVAVHSYSACMSTTNWYQPESFEPERWLSDKDDKFAVDQNNAMQPFSTGPRVCIGKNLAYAELTSVLARMLFNFDITLCEESRDWGKHQKTFNFWEKPPLMVQLKLSDKVAATFAA